MSKLYYNRVRYVFNRENDFTAEVPVGAWNFVKQTNEFVPAPVAEKEPKEETVTEKPKEEPKKKSVICDICGFKAKSFTGLLAHSRKHRGKK